jgi:hypothetical protein
MAVVLMVSGVKWVLGWFYEVKNGVVVSGYS